MNKDRTADLNIAAAAEQPNGQVGDVLRIKALRVIEAGQFFRHLSNYHPRTDRINSNSPLLILALNIFRQGVEGVF